MTFNETRENGKRKTAEFCNHTKQSIAIIQNRVLQSYQTEFCNHSKQSIAIVPNRVLQLYQTEYCNHTKQSRIAVQIKNLFNKSWSDCFSTLLNFQMVQYCRALTILFNGKFNSSFNPSESHTYSDGNNELLAEFYSFFLVSRPIVQRKSTVLEPEIINYSSFFYLWFQIHDIPNGGVTK